MGTYDPYTTITEPTFVARFLLDPDRYARGHGDLARIPRIQREPGSKTGSDPVDRVHRAAARQPLHRPAAPLRELLGDEQTDVDIIDVELVVVHLHIDDPTEPPGGITLTG